MAGLVPGYSSTIADAVSKRRYTEKLKFVGGIDPYEVAKGNWQDDVDLWSAIMQLQVCMYLILALSPFSEKDWLVQQKKSSQSEGTTELQIFVNAQHTVTTMSRVQMLLCPLGIKWSIGWVVLRNDYFCLRLPITCSTCILQLAMPCDFST